MSTYSADILATAGLVSYWRLGEPSGVTATDANGANNGTYTGALTLGTTGLLTGDSDTAVTFPGASTAYVLAKSGFLLAGLTNSTVELWMTRNGTAPTSNGLTLYCERAASGNDIFKLEINTTRADSNSFAEFTYRDDAGTLNRFAGVTSIVDNLRHHVVVTKSGTSIVIYVDGVSDATGTLTATNTFTNASPESRLGGDIADTLPAFPGVLDEVAIYNVALSPATVSDHFTVGSTGAAAAQFVPQFNPIPFMR